MRHILNFQPVTFIQFSRKYHPVFHLFATLPFVIFLTFSLNISFVNAQGPQSDSKVFVLADSQNAQALAQIEAFINHNGGRVMYIFPGQALIAQWPSQKMGQLSALSTVDSIFTQEIPINQLNAFAPAKQNLALMWNSLIAPDTASKITGDDDNHFADQPEHLFIAPDLPTLKDLQSSTTPNEYQTSAFMAGSVVVSPILLESDGTIDPSTEDWTFEEKQQVFNNMVAGLNWWLEREPRANLSFIIDPSYVFNPLPSKYEPITQASQTPWIKDAMQTLGYNDTSYFQMVRDFVNDQRAAYQTDWSYAVFVVDSSNDADGAFPNNLSAYAYLNGPFLVMTYDNGGYGINNMPGVFAHETGHIFGALDQYYGNCTNHSGYLDIETQNISGGGCFLDEPSIMKDVTGSYLNGRLDPYAAGQIGWLDSDQDGILDPLDNDLPITLNYLTVESQSVTISGTTQIAPFPSPTQASVSINTIAGVAFKAISQLSAETVFSATAIDGQFDGITETFTSTFNLAPGLYNIEVSSYDSAGNQSAKDAVTGTISILDPLDIGLNTELTQGADGVYGVAYHMGSGRISNVEYRINQGQWQAATPLDGAFNSNYEPFTIAGIDMSSTAPQQIETRAYDETGYAEQNRPALNIVAPLTLSLNAPATALSGKPFTYTLTVTNSGNITLTNLVISNSVPVGADVVAVLAGGQLLSGPVVSWTVAALPAKASISVQYAVIASTTVTNSLYQASADNGLRISGTRAVSTLILAPALSISLSGPTAANQGDSISYTLTVSNNGSITATNLIITDVVPAGILDVQVLDGGQLLNDGTIVWAVTDLAPGKAITVRFTGRVSATVANNIYAVKADGGLKSVGLRPVVTTVSGGAVYQIFLPAVLK